MHSKWSELNIQSKMCAGAASLSAGRALGFHADVRAALVCKAVHKIWLPILVVQIYTHN